MPVMDDQAPYKVIRALLRRHEGYRTQVYTDTRGNLTIGVGHNLKNGISAEAVDFIFDEDLKACRMDCVMKLAWFISLDEVRQDVIMDMVFNMGIAKFYEFSKMIHALEGGFYERAAQEMLSSQWASEVTERAFELSEMMRTGAYSIELLKDLKNVRG